MNIPAYNSKLPDGVTERFYTVLPEHTDRFGHLRLSILTWQITRLAFDHIGSYGFDYHHLREENRLWMVIWNQMEFTRIPVAGEELLLRLWSGKGQSVMQSRKCAIYTKQGDPIGSMTALFAMIDAQTRTMTTAVSDIRKIPIVELENEPKRPNMFMTFPEEFPHKTEKTVQASQIDPNGHMNNSFYFDWAMEVLPEEFAASHTPASFWVEYRKELLEGQTAVLSWTIDETDTLYIVGKIGEDTSFSMKVEFR